MSLQYALQILSTLKFLGPKMELQPTSETEKGLLEVLKNWMDKCPESAVDKLKRVFLTCSLELQNEDKFVALLYGQTALEESPSALSERFPAPLLRAQYAMETALNKSCVKELVVALEVSENGGALTGIQKWTEEHCKEIREAMKSLSTDLAPVRVPRRRMLSELTPRTELKPRTREISLRLEEKNNANIYVVEVCNEKIIVGWQNCQIEIYSSTDLGRQTVLNYYRSPVTCLQCTCTEIIAGHENGNICAWNIEKGKMVHELSIKETREHVRRMRWRAPRLVVVTTNNKVKILQYYGTSFALLCSWAPKLGPVGVILHADFFEKDVVVFVTQTGCVDGVNVKDLNGQQIRSISFEGLRSAALNGSYVILLRADNFLRILDISTGAVFKELEGQLASHSCMDAHDGVFGTSYNKDGIQRTIIWNVKAVLDGTGGQLADFSYQNFPYHNWGVLKLGQNIIVTGYTFNKPTIKVTDFVA